MDGRSCFSESLAKEYDDWEGLLRASSDDEKGTESSESAESNLPTFTLAELESSFNADSVLGQGRLGPVYKGKLKNTDQTVAIRRLNLVDPQRHGEFASEAKMLSKLDHPNIVKLIGYCIEGEQRLLIYEYMPHGSLDSHLFRDYWEMRSLDWNTRMEIALAVAKGLKYLHVEQDPPIIHGNLKCSNVLLGEGYKAKLSDIGLAEKVMPRCNELDKLTLESDIYGYGLLLAEILTGKRVIGNSSSSAKEMEKLIAWAELYVNGEKRVPLEVDFLVNDCNKSEFGRAEYVVAKCLEEDAIRRPLIAEIINDLTSPCPMDKQYANEIITDSGSRT